MKQPDDPLIFRVTLGFLKAGRVVDAASSVLLFATVWRLLSGLPIRPPVAVTLGLSLALGLLAKYYAWRMALDADFFALLAAEPQRAEAFDTALAEFLGSKKPVPVRSLASRWRGARRLVVRQALVVAGQLLAVGVGLVLGH